MFDAIVPPEFDLKVFDDPALAQDIPPAALNTEKIDPELYKSVGQFIPEVAAFVEETNPQLIQASGVAKEGRQSQLDALRKYKEIAAGGVDPEFEQKMSQASQRAQLDSQSRMDSILQDSNRRGTLGSGLEVAAQMQGSSDAMNRNALEGQAAAADSYRNQMRALDQSANIGGQVRSSEMAEQGRNVGIINDFNQRSSKAYQQYLQAQASAANNANLRNLNNEQSLANRNVEGENAANRQQRDMANNAARHNYDAKQNNRTNRLDLEQRKNHLKQRMYQNLLDKARGKAGIASTQINNMNEGARDRNKIIAGSAGSIQKGIMYSDSKGDEPQSTPDKYYEDGGGAASQAGKRYRTDEDEQEGNYY